MERRKFHRLAFDTPVRIVGSAQLWQSKLVDISLKGALVERPEDWEGTSGERFLLEILLSVGTIIKMNAIVVHSNKGHIGFRCEHMDIDSISHLRRLVMLNLDDPSLLDRDLAALVDT